jgi:hypothetical protein
MPFTENGSLKLLIGKNLWSEAMSRMTLSSGGTFKDLMLLKKSLQILGLSGIFARHSAARKI